jgi:hypothetical protein
MRTNKSVDPPLLILTKSGPPIIVRADAIEDVLEVLRALDRAQSYAANQSLYGRLASFIDRILSHRSLNG